MSDYAEKIIKIMIYQLCCLALILDNLPQQWKN